MPLLPISDIIAGDFASHDWDLTHAGTQRRYWELDLMNAGYPRYGALIVPVRASTSVQKSPALLASLL